jgi:dATP pyrophosphohydrolase
MPEIVSDYVGVYAFRHGPDGVEFLQLRRADSVFMGGTWQPIHGRIELGEKAWQTAVRELREETALTPIALYQIESVNTFYDATDDKIHHCPSFAAEVAVDASVQIDEEHTAFRWLAMTEAAEAFLWPGQRQAIREICDEIIADGPAKRYLRIDIPKR